MKVLLVICVESCPALRALVSNVSASNAFCYSRIHPCDIELYFLAITNTTKSPPTLQSLLKYLNHHFDPHKSQTFQSKPKEFKEWTRRVYLVSGCLEQPTILINGRGISDAPNSIKILMAAQNLHLDQHLDQSTQWWTDVKNASLVEVCFAWLLFLCLQSHHGSLWEC